MGVKSVTIFLLFFLGVFNSLTVARGTIFAWDPSADDSNPGRVAGYTVYYGTQFFTDPHGLDESGLPITDSVTVQGQTSANVPLVPNTTYYLAVTASDANGIESELSNIAVFTTSAPLPPQCSTNLNGSLGVSWESRPDPAEPQRIAQFVLFYSTERFTVDSLFETNSVLVNSLSVGRQTNVVLSNLSLGANYYFAVAVRLADSTVSDLSNIAEFEIPAPTPPKCSVGDDGKILVTWAARPDRGKPGLIAGYNLYYSATPFDFNSIQTSNSSIRLLNAGSQTNVVLTTLVLNQTYYFGVATYDRKGVVAELSDLTVFTTPPFNSGTDLRPFPPVALSLQVAGWDLSQEEGTITVSWGPSPDPADIINFGYVLYYSTNFFDNLYNLSQSDNSALQAIVVGEQTTATLTNLAPGNTYYFAVTAYRSDFVQSELSNISIASTTSGGQTPTSPPASPSSLSVGTDEAGTNGAVRVTWSPSPDAATPGRIAGYNVYYENLSGGIAVLTVEHHTSITLTNLAVDGTYYFAATAFDSAGVQSLLTYAPVFAFPGRLDLLKQLPSLTVDYSNNIPILTIQGTLGAEILVESTSDPSDPGGWVEVADLVLTQGEPVPPTADVLGKAFVPATEIFADEASPTEDGIKSYRLQMLSGYTTIASEVLKPLGYTTRLISVRLPDLSTHVVCYVAEENAYIDYNDQTHLAKLHSSGSKIREIAIQVANSLNTSWISASEFVVSGELRIIIATVVRTDPPDSDPL